MLRTMQELFNYMQVEIFGTVLNIMWDLCARTVSELLLPNFLGKFLNCSQPYLELSYQNGSSTIVLTIVSFNIAEQFLKCSRTDPGLF